MLVSIIVARADNGVIGKDNSLPWRLSADLKFFKNTTTGHHIIMGRKTYESIGKPLPNRTNVIITRNADYKAEGCEVVGSLDEAIKLAKANNETEAFIVGGSEIYNQAIEFADNIYLTEVKANVDGDTYFPELNKTHWLEESRESHLADAKNYYNFDFVKLTNSFNTLSEIDQKQVVTPDKFRNGMSMLAGAVNIIATDGKAGKGGITASAVVSVSDNPATILVCINNQNILPDLLSANGCFSVNILAQNHEDLSNRFAGMHEVSMEDRFNEGSWETMVTSAPVLNDSLASFDCRYTEMKTVGTHKVVFGQIIDVKINDNKDIKPLIYFNRAYRDIS